MRAMILAAGLGTRLGPLTDECAKPALPVLDDPVILGLVRMLAAQGVERIVVNTHAHPESVRQALRDAPVPIEFSHESVLRGSGGGIQAARARLGSGGAFLVLNGDMRIDLDVHGLVRTHERLGVAATLLLRDDPRKDRYGTLGFDGGGRVCRITDLVVVTPEAGNGLFTGVHVLEPRIFDRMPTTIPFDIVRDVYVPMLEREEPLGAAVHLAAARWGPLGTPEELLDANLAALRERLPAGDVPEEALHIEEGARIHGDLLGPVWIGRGAVLEAEACVGPDVVLGAGCRVERGARVERAVVLPRARVPGDVRLRDAIVGVKGTWNRA